MIHRHLTKDNGYVLVIEDLFSISLMGKVLSAILKMPRVIGTPDSGGFDTISFDMSASVGGFKFGKIYDLIYKRLENHIKQNFYIDAVFNGNKIRTPSIKIQKEGQHHVVHSDYEYSNSVENTASVVLPKNAISSIICLNSDYSGGSLIFPDDDISIQLKAGSACVFTSTGNRHGVTEVISGSRYSLINFGEVAQDGNQ